MFVIIFSGKYSISFPIVALPAKHGLYGGYNHFSCFGTKFVIRSIGRKQRPQPENFCIETRIFGGNIPFVYTRGNHETRGPASRELSNYVDSPNGENFYSFEWGNSIFLILDTGEDKPDTHPVYAGLADYDSYRNKQAAWAMQVVSSKAWRKAKHRVVCGHTHEPKLERAGLNHNFNMVVGGGPKSEKENSNTTYIRVDIVGDKLHVALYDIDGKLLDEYQ